MTYAAFGLLDGTASLTGDAFRQRGNFRGKGIVGDDLVDEADAQGLCGIDHLAREEQQGSRAPAHQTGQALGAAESGRDAEADFGLAEAGLFGCDADIAGKGQFTAAAKGKARDHGDGGLAQGLYLGEYLLPKGTEGHTGFRFHGLHLRDVRSGGESLLSGPPDDEDADLGIAVDCGKGVVKFLQYGAVQRVQPIGTVQREVSHAVLFLKKDVLVHNPLPSLQAVACQGPESRGRRFQIRTGRRDRCRTGGVQGPSSLPCWPDGRS